MILGLKPVKFVLGNKKAISFTDGFVIWNYSAAETSTAVESITTAAVCQQQQCP
jgi:hypothetical protein